jgi:GDP-L-fucose synthase
MSFFNNKNILVTGGTGMVGVSLVNQLLEENAKVRVVSIDDVNPFDEKVEYLKKDLRIYDNCLDVCKDMDFVFHLAGIKGSPAVALNKPASFFVPTILFNTCLIDAAIKQKVRHVLYTSSIGVYSPAEIFYEDDVWSTFPSENDRFAGWAKRMGELQLQAYSIENNFDNFSIVRPANVYGPYDNFDPETAMVIPSLINRAINSEDTLSVWGDGSAVRDFIFSKDVARGMMICVEKGYNKPINLGSGEGITIKELVENIVENLPEKKLKISWDTSKPTGDKIRLMDMKRANSIGFHSQTKIKDGISETISWFKNNLSYSDKKYNSFK